MDFPKRAGVPKPAPPAELPANPLPLLDSWLKEAFAEIQNAHAMTLATVNPDGRPSARMVICRGIDTRVGWIVFYTDRESAKGKTLDVNPYAALVINWDAHERQARIEGESMPKTRTAAPVYRTPVCINMRNSEFSVGGWES